MRVCRGARTSISHHNATNQERKHDGEGLGETSTLDGSYWHSARAKIVCALLWTPPTRLCLGSPLKYPKQEPAVGPSCPGRSLAPSDARAGEHIPEPLEGTSPPKHGNPRATHPCGFIA